MIPELIQTADGSHSLYLKELDEHYHSIHGAIQESIHVFIHAGFNYFQEKQALSILEVGLGTGLNALLTLIETKKSGKNIHYTSLEAFPLDLNVVQQLNYPALLNAAELKDSFLFMHSCDWNVKQQITSGFTFRKLLTKVQECNFDEQYNLIYFDAFGPRVQPEMWVEEVFAKIYAVLNSNGVLVTYCAKGEVKRTLKKVGFLVETLPGPPGKREMIRAIKVI